MDTPQTSMLQRLLAVAQAAKPGDPTSQYDPTKLVPPEAPQPVTAAPMPEITPPQANDVVPPQETPSAAEPQTPDTPKLAPQGPKNGFLKILSQIAGQSGDQPKPGEEYNGPTKTSEKIGGAMRLAGRIGNGLAAAAGTPGQQELAEKRSEFGPELQATTALKKAQIESNDLYHRGQIAVGHEKNDVSEANAQGKNYVAQQRASVYARSHGQVLDPNSPTGIRSMTEDEVLSDPVLSQNRDLAKSAMMLKQAQAAAAASAGQPGGPLFEQKKHQIEATLAMAQANFGAKMHSLANSDRRIEQGDQRIGMMQDRLGMMEGKQGLGVWQPALDSGQRLQVMRKSYDAALQNHDQQAMLNLLANHLGMTMGLQKGARLNQAIISEAEKSRPWLQGMEAKFDSDGYLSGVNLTPQQMQQMMTLGEERYKSDVDKARFAAPYLGVEGEPELPVDPNSMHNNPTPKGSPVGPAHRRGSAPAAPAAPVNATDPLGIR